ncbi:C2HC-type zinc finger protein [Calothrix sp. PCC 7507]|uniref:C2HC-type zinc finger protein n=1 Tax=Calothrix sp. PCC 7507 TaxID=99598 RepID=UPI00029EE668|nr:C2HC-type zinc finger protein [Calothrix sp. PCC 7507]AFY31881.1 hypothetical protein Cal7507_1415 [Calothrix sp. PCC 7507]
MCNAWNHSPLCNCGWGGVDYGTQGYGNLLSLSLENVINCSRNSNILKDEEAKTFPVSCPWCGTIVFYHTNGFGDSVYFDSLGYPWQIHECFKRYWENKKALLKTNLNSPEINHDSGFFGMTVNQQKRLILVGAARKIPNVIVGEFLIYRMTEESLAKQMTISMQHLRNIYGHLYITETAGIKILSDEELEPIVKSKVKPNTIINQQRVVSLVRSEVKPNTITNQQQVVPIKSNQKNKRIPCPYCKRNIRSDRLKKHIKNKCVVKNSR